MTATRTEVPCRCCGVATDQNVSTQTAYDSLGRPKAEYAAGVCGDCVSLRPDEPGVAVRAALRVLGKAEDEPLAAQAFLDAGVDVGPVLYARSTPQRKAWAHVDREGRAALRAGYARLLDAKVHASVGEDRPVPPHAPPDGYPAACASCGVSRSAQWFSTRTRMLSRGPAYEDVCVCAETCAPVLERVGGVGQTFVELAAQAALGTPAPVQGARPWLATGLPPQDRPFGWVALAEPEENLDLSDLTALQVAVRSLAAKVADLEARLGS